MQWLVKVKWLIVNVNAVLCCGHTLISRISISVCFLRERENHVYMSLNLQLKNVETIGFQFLHNNAFSFTYPFHHQYHTHASLSFPSPPQTRFRPPTTVFSALTAEQSATPPVRMVAVVGNGAASPLKSASWEQVMLHTVTYPLKFSFLQLLYQIQ